MVMMMMPVVPMGSTVIVVMVMFVRMVVSMAVGVIMIMTMPMIVSMIVVIGMLLLRHHPIDRAPRTVEHVELDGGDGAPHDRPDRERDAFIDQSKRTDSLTDRIERRSRIYQRADRHIAADAVEAIEVGVAFLPWGHGRRLVRGPSLRFDPFENSVNGPLALQAKADPLHSVDFVGDRSDPLRQSSALRCHRP